MICVNLSVRVMTNAHKKVVLLRGYDIEIAFTFKPFFLSQFWIMPNKTWYMFCLS
jgi:hypothetical protein